MKLRNGLIVLTALALLLPLAAHAQRGDPELGTWKLDVARSKFDGASAPTSGTRTYTQTPHGIQMTEQIVTDGEARTRGWTLKRDGKPYPETGNPNFDALAVTRISALRFKSDLMRGGQLVGHADTIVSKDHKILTIDVRYKNTAGQPVHTVSVYQRQ